MASTPSWRSLALLLALIALPAQAQLGDLVKKVIPPGLRASEPAPTAPARSAATPGAAPMPGSATAVLAGDAPPVGAQRNVEPELKPDVDCKRPREKFGVVDKLTHYGGNAAVRRLERLIQSDFKYSDLTPQDKKMLDYLAKTTIWVPPEIENRLAALFAGGSTLFGGTRLTELDRAAMKLIDMRLATLKGAVQDFPTEIKLSLNKKLPDGAFARFGGTIELSDRFMSGMTEKPEGGDFVLAHELSHIYKRHALKLLQFRLISTSEGWELGRKLLQRAQRGLAVDTIADANFVVTVVPKLIDYVRGMQLKFNQDQELEADACSTVWMKATGIDLFAAWDAYRATVIASAQAPADGYESTHPTTQERERRFKNKAAGKPNPPTVKKGAVTPTTPAVAATSGK